VQSIKHCISSLKFMGNYDMCETQGNFVLALTRCKASNCHVSIIEKVCSATEIVQKRRRVDAVDLHFGPEIGLKYHHPMSRLIHFRLRDLI
jgi:hypothetical protein